MILSIAEGVDLLSAKLHGNIVQIAERDVFNKGRFSELKGICGFD